MKISTIALRNFRSGQNLTLDLSAPRVYICGRNGTGKSSIKDAIRWSLRGVCQATDAKGLGWEELIPPGTTTLSAGVVLDGIGGVERTYKEGAGGRRSLQLEGRDNDISSTQQAIYQLLATTPEYLDAVCETDYFLRLHHAEAKAMVLGLLNVRIPVGDESLTLAQADARFKQAYADRTLAKARQKDVRVVPFTVPAEGMLPAVEAIKAKLDPLKAELTALVAQTGTTSGKRAILAQQLAAVQSRPQRVAPPPMQFEAEERRLQTEIQRLEHLAEEAAQEQRTWSAPVAPADVTALIATLEAHKPKQGCVLDPHVRCDTAKIVFRNRIKALQAEQATPAQAPPPAAPAPSQETYSAGAHRLAIAELLALRGQQEAFLAAQKANHERQDEIDALTAQISSLGPSPEADSAAVETLKARIAKGELLLERSRDQWSQKDAHDKAQAKKQEIDAEVDRLEALVEVLGPNGARVEALKAAIGTFETAINTVTRRFGWNVVFWLEPWTVLVNGRKITAYSESEQFRIGIAVQLAIAAASGLGFLVVDRLDMLDVENRGIVTRMLLEPTPAIQQVVILATREPNQPLPAPDGVKAFRLATDDAGKTIIAETSPERVVANV